MPAPLVVGDHGPARGILTRERRVAFRPAALPGDALLRRPPRQERGILRQRLLRERAQRRQVVDDPDSASMRRDHQVAVARLDLEVAHRHRGEIAPLPLRPTPPPATGHPETELRPSEAECLADYDLLD